MTTVGNGRAQRLLVRMAAYYSPRCGRSGICPRTSVMWVNRAAHPPRRTSLFYTHHRHFATSSSPPPTSASPSNRPPPPHPHSLFAPPPATPPPNPHLSATELSAEQLDAILRIEQQRRTTVQAKQQHLTTLLQQLQHETAADEAAAALTRYERVVAALGRGQRGVKLLAVVLAITSLAVSMQLLVAKEATQQSTAAARQRLDERRDGLVREEAAVEEVVRGLRQYIAMRTAEEASGSEEEKAWLHALQRRVSELEAVRVCGVDEMRARQAVQVLERDINARYEANKRKPWW